MTLTVKLKKYGKGWGWTAHRIRGYLGGVDWKTPTGTYIYSDAVGSAYKDADDTVSVHYAAGKKITWRELGAVYGKFPRTVKIGSRIGTAGRKWVHQDATIDGKRVSYEGVFASYIRAEKAKAAAKKKAARAADVRKIGKYLNSLGYGQTTKASTTGQTGLVYWRLLRTWGKANGLYPKSSPLNGTVGAGTKKLETQMLARLNAGTNA